MLTKEALEFIANLGETELIPVGELDYTPKPLHLVKEPTPAALEVSTLSSLVDYLKANFDNVSKVIVSVENYDRVVCYSPLNKTASRAAYIVAKAKTPHTNFDSYLSQEKFIIWMQSGFIQNDDSKVILQVVGNLQEEKVRSFSDDGTSQVVATKTGVATVANVKVPNPVHLAPYRTFVELEQPISKFVFRMQDGAKAALFEADGGAWKAEAMQRAKTFLQHQLSAEIEAGMVTILA